MINRVGSPMNRDVKILLYAASVLIIIFVTATSLFVFFENRYRSNEGKEPVTAFESAYWAVVTLSTVGYGDISAESPEGRAITMFLIVVGLSVYVYVITTVGSFLIRRGLKEAKGLSKCEFENHVVVLGMNEVVEEAIRQLVHSRRKVAVVVETGEDVDKVARLEAFPILGDPTQPSSLEMANAASADTILINLQDDSKTILAALACRRVSKSVRIVASIKQRELIELVRESGVESVLSPQALTGRMLASAVFEPHVIDFVDDVTSGVEGADLREFGARNILVAGRSVGEALTSLRKETGTLLVGLVRTGEQQKAITNPDDCEMIGDEDKVILLGYDEQFSRVRARMGA